MIDEVPAVRSQRKGFAFEPMKSGKKQEKPADRSLVSKISTAKEIVELLEQHDWVYSTRSDVQA
jgi:hypothetical protein